MTNNLNKKSLETLDSKNNNISKNISIGIFSSSSPQGQKNINRVLNAKKFLESKSLKINLGSLWDKIDFYRTGSIQARVKEFNDLLKTNLVLMSMIGGMNSSSILPYIDYDLIQKNKTKIVGYSDTTAILLAVYAKTGIPTYYGPALLPSFEENDYIQNYDFNSFNDYVLNNKIGKLENPEFWSEDKIDFSILNPNRNKKMLQNNLISFNDAIVEGKLIGGNLNTMALIIGTEYMPKIEKGDILFIEDTGRKASECERNFAVLKNSGILDKVSGIVIGKPELFDDEGTNRKYHEILMEFIDRPIPILAQYDSSHTQPMNVLKIGGRIKLDTANKTITFLN